MRHVTRNGADQCQNVHGGGGLQLAKLAHDPASTRPKPCASLKNTHRILPVRRSSLALAERKRPRSEISFPFRIPSIPPLILAPKGSAVPWLANNRAALRPRRSGACSPDSTCCGALPGFPRQCHLPLACHILSRGIKSALGRGAPDGHHPHPTRPLPRLNRLTESRRQPSLEGESGPEPTGKTLPQSYPKQKLPAHTSVYY